LSKAFGYTAFHKAGLVVEGIVGIGDDDAFGLADEGFPHQNVVASNG